MIARSTRNSAVDKWNADTCGPACAVRTEPDRRPTQVKLVRAGELTPQHISAWTQIVRSNPLFDSPFFRPEFVQQVAQFRDDVEVAVLEYAGQAIGFFAFQRLRCDVGVPVGMSLSDCHGVVIAADATFDAQELLRACGLRAWRFDHVSAAQREFSSHQWFAAHAPYMDLSRGYDHYYRERRRSGSGLMKKLLRKTRKIEREVGSLQFVAFSADRSILEQLVAEKINHYRRMRCVNHLGEPWRIELLRSLIDTRGDEFAGMLSVLMIEDRVIAINLGLLSCGVVHCWLASHADELSRYSPGLLLLLRMAQESCDLGIRRIDLGKGEELYKQRLMSGAMPLIEGAVDLRPVAGRLGYAWARLRELIRDSPLRRPAQTLVRGTRKWMTYR